ncbi:MAG TPA: MFS transporter, partial [Nitrolancea sp.]|nr:MFS transporter [Nitrolancea sp.]
SLRTRNFRLFFIGQTISNTGNWLTNVALTLLVLKLTTSGVAIGLLAACQYGPMMFLSAWAGALADRRDKRHLLFVTQSLEMAQSIGLAILAFMPHPPLGGIYALAFCGGVLLAFDNPMRRSFVTEMVPDSDLPNAVVLYSTIVNVSRIFGPALAGVLVVTVGFGWGFTLDAASYVAVIICLILMRPSELYREAPKPRTPGAVREGFRYVRSVPTLWITFAMLAINSTLAYNFNVTLPLFVTRGLHAGDGAFTLLYSVLSTGAVVCALFIARRNVITMRQIIVGSALLGLALLMLSAVPDVVFAIPVVFFVGITGILYTNASTAIVQIQSRRDMRGRVVSLQTIIIGGSAALGGPILGAIADSAGARPLMVLGGAVCMATAVFGHFTVNSHHERAPAPADD